MLSAGVINHFRLITAFFCVASAKVPQHYIEQKEYCKIVLLRIDVTSQIPVWLVGNKNALKNSCKGPSSSMDHLICAVDLAIDGTSSKSFKAREPKAEETTRSRIYICKCPNG